MLWFHWCEKLLSCTHLGRNHNVIINPISIQPRTSHRRVERQQEQVQGQQLKGRSYTYLYQKRATLLSYTHVQHSAAQHSKGMSMGGRGSNDSLRPKFDLFKDTGWDIKKDSIENDEDLKRFLAALARIGPYGYSPMDPPKKYRFGTNEFEWDTKTEEAEFGKMVVAGLMELDPWELKIGMEATAFLVLLSTLSKLVNQYKNDAFERQYAIEGAQQQMKDWLEENGINATEPDKSMYAAYMEYHERDFTPLIDWMRKGGYDDFLPPEQYIRGDIYDWMHDPDGYISVKDDYMGSPGYDPTDRRWDEFIAFVVREGWKTVSYPVALPGGIDIDNADDIEPYKTAKGAGTALIWLSIMVGIWLLLG